jgi:hypothetical protein
MKWSEIKTNLPPGWKAADAHEEGHMLHELRLSLPTDHILKGQEFSIDALSTGANFDLLCQSCKIDGLFTVVRWDPESSVHLAVIYHGKFTGFREKYAAEQDAAPDGNSAALH